MSSGPGVPRKTAQCNCACRSVHVAAEEGGEETTTGKPAGAGESTWRRQNVRARHSDPKYKNQKCSLEAQHLSHLSQGGGSGGRAPVKITRETHKQFDEDDNTPDTNTIK